MEYLVSLKNPFATDAVLAQLSGATAGGLQNLAPWPTGNPISSPFGVAPSQPFSSIGHNSFSLMARPVVQNADYALFFLSSKGGSDHDYFVINNSRTLVHDRRLNWSYWDQALIADKLEVTADQLKAICPPASAENIAKHLKHINDTMRKYEINTRLRQAHFLAQLSVESDRFRTTREYASGAEYEGRTDLGNTQPGDGVRFRGRGLIQITGRDAYKQYGHYVNKDLTTGNNIFLLEQEPYASDSAGWFWLIFKKSKDINARADRDDVVAVTRAVNGGLNGLDERKRYLASAKKEFGI